MIILFFLDLPVETLKFLFFYLLTLKKAEAEGAQ